MKISFGAETAGIIQLQDPNPFLYFKKLLKELEEKNYGEEFIDIGIVPIIMPEEYHERYPERRQLWRKKREADIRLFVDYEKYARGTKEEKLLLWLKCMIEAIEIIESRKKGDFQGEKLIEDILKAMNVKREDLEKL